ncbi:unnamed protein product [Aspergillus oryzae]|nr:unnamed protein product [Aspergillus oryzae]GMF86645.1 unnamed protein product [Aspergillus oryzae]
MFPQLSTRDIMWDLQRNGGNVAATTERILTGRGLETVAIPQASAPAQTAAASTASKSEGQDLISRYNLSGKVATEGAETTQSSPSSGWSQNKEERQRILQKRRDDMILAARKRMEQKVRESA